MLLVAVQKVYMHTLVRLPAIISVTRQSYELQILYAHS